MGVRFENLCCITLGVRKNSCLSLIQIIIFALTREVVYCSLKKHRLLQTNRQFDTQEADIIDGNIYLAHYKHMD